VGKTTLLLQYLKKQNLNYDQKIYVSLDELYFTSHTLLDFATLFYQQGGRLLVLDEVHKYNNWAREIKNLYDRYAELKIVFTGSSILDITQREGDLSRRAVMFTMQGLSYREFLTYEYGIEIPKLTLDMLPKVSMNFEDIFPKNFKPLQYFAEYLQYGYYPFRLSTHQDYQRQLRMLTRTIVEYDMAEIKGFDVRQAKKLLQLIYIIAQQAPFKPNISKLADKTHIHRNSLPNYLYFLEESKLISLLFPKNYSIATLQKPEKIYLENTNLAYALSNTSPEIGTMRETFFFNQVASQHSVNQSKVADFLIDELYTFEIGGAGKKATQIQSVRNAWVAKDQIERGIGKTIPLWLFGFLY